MYGLLKEYLAVEGSGWSTLADLLAQHIKTVGQRTLDVKGLVGTQNDGLTARGVGALSGAHEMPFHQEVRWDAAQPHTCGAEDLEFVEGLVRLHQDFTSLVDERMDGKAIFHYAVRVRHHDQSLWHDEGWVGRFFLTRGPRDPSSSPCHLTASHCWSLPTLAARSLGFEGLIPHRDGFSDGLLL